MTPDGYTLELPKWYDLHVHLRQDEMLPPLIADHIKMGCAGVLAMPNTKPPTAKVLKNDPLPYWSVEEYLEMLRNAGGDAFEDMIVPLYLTRDTTPEMIAKGAESGVLRTCKYYPPHGTTGADFAYPFDELIDAGVLKAMEEHDIVLNIHPEEHDLPGEDYFDRHTNAEEIFYKERLPRAVDKYPNLRIVGEHLTTKVGADFIAQAPEHVKATITPHHLMYTVGHLVMGFKYHLYCMPLVKFDEDREALRAAILDPNNTKFFAGTDSAPHTEKATPCGCAAGCYTGGIAPQLYAEVFEMAGADLSSEEGFAAFKKFLCEIGPEYYGLKIPEETFTLEKSPQETAPLKIGDQEVIPLPMGMGSATMPWSIVS